MKKLNMLKLIGSSLILTMALAACSNKKMNMGQNQNQSSQSGIVSGQNKNIIYTANESGSISIIDTATYKVIGTVKDSGTPHNVQVSPDGKVFAYTSPLKMEEGQKEDQSMKMNNPGAVVFYDTQIGKGAHGVYVTPDNKYVYVTNMFENTVSVIDNITNNVIQTIPVDGEPNGISHK